MIWEYPSDSDFGASSLSQASNYTKGKPLKVPEEPGAQCIPTQAASVLEGQWEYRVKCQNSALVL